MKLVALIVSCCLAHVYCDTCGPSEVATVKKQWFGTFVGNHYDGKYEAYKRDAYRQFADAALQK